MTRPHVYWVSGRADGNCHVEVTFRSGAVTFAADAQVAFRNDGCCSGFIADPVLVPGLDAALPAFDAGASDGSDDAPATD
jgi:hypothetical protein